MRASFYVYMQYTVKTQNFELSASQTAFAKRLGISREFLRLLLGRGMKEDEIFAFLHPSIDNLSSPFEIDGMKEAAERIRKAIANKEKVLIYGDYDCDGICAISTLMLYLRDKLDVFYFIPDRNKDGYGISVDTLKRILANHSPSLVITVDTGITAVEEVEYLKSIGIDTIVTDHHEPQEKIPDCIVVDPKVARKGFFDLCGAGVALKLVEALSNRQETCKYLDIVSIATIADVVPLVGDNRIIAYYGLKQITTSPRKGVKMLLNQETVSSQDVMFRLAPRMNAAGRLNSAMKVVGLFLENDYFLLRTLTEELARDNAARQELCENAVESAKQMLKGADFDDMGIIALYSDKWEPGILGIACARLVEEFKRPAVLFAKNGEELRGSARSVPSVNIFELFCSLSEYFMAFGGHAQAAGVSMNVSAFEDFKTAANKKLLSEHRAEDFTHVVECEMQLPMNMDFLSFAKELELLEPTGYQNPKPTFLIEAQGLKFERIGFSQHVKYTGSNIELMGFSKFAQCLFPVTGKVNLEVTLGVNVFQNRENAQGIIQTLEFENVDITPQESECMNLHQLSCEGSVILQNSLNAQGGAAAINTQSGVISGGEQKGKILQNTDFNTLKTWLKEPFGTVVVCFSQEEYDKICGECAEVKNLPVLIATPRCLNPENCVVVCPAACYDFSFYKRVVVAGRPLCEGYLAKLQGETECYALGDITPKQLRITDDRLRNIYKEVFNIAAKGGKQGGYRKMYIAVCSRYKVKESEFYAAMTIFEQLGLIEISDRGIVTVSRKKSNLSDSVVYRNLLHA